MIDWIVALMLTPISLVCLLLLAVLFEHNRHSGMTTVTIIAMLVIGYFLVSPSLQQVLYTVGLWIPIGVCWAWLKFKLHCNRVADQFAADEISHSTAMRELDVHRNKGRIVYWAWAWPVSILQSGASGVIETVQLVVTEICSTMFTSQSKRTKDKINKLLNDRVNDQQPK